ncbi:AAA family ATPase [Bacillus sp. Cs-700]|uniref:ATP-dependent nuclease n=1 Tax=Bacillus sp. Cs-700 TaxID=2589818 RepID=UPI00140ADF74|nr:AAA family ATPase [Bacillus sp. Cs-700]
MNAPHAPYISRVKIKNFRNFKNIDVELDHKQVIIGENNVGKTNFLRAIQLILDPKLSDDDRYLLESDFYDGLNNPLENGEEIEISIEIRGYDHNRMLMATLSDATISDSPPTLRLTYQYYSSKNPDGSYNYMFRIYQGDKTETPFSHYHRKYLNLRVINAIRDVESEMKNTRKSPVNQLLKGYDIRKEELQNIADKLKKTSDEVLSTDELIDLTNNINNRFSKIIGSQVDSTVSLDTMNFDPNKILNTLKLMIGDGKRPTSDTSLGLNNILYISLILLSLEDKTIPSILKSDIYEQLLSEDGSEILKYCYFRNENNNYILTDEISKVDHQSLYDFMDNFFSTSEGFTILAIEEPESHLHPGLQRVIYKDVMKKNTSVLMTTHSPYITSVSPINSIVHLRNSQNGTKVKTTASLKLNNRDKNDLERYIDVKKGEIYFGKGIILVEGIAEEYLIPSFAELLEYPLDNKGIICCNINSTNFKPYVKFLDALGIPYVVITDGDYYYLDDKNNKVFGEMWHRDHEIIGYDGNERIGNLLLGLNKVNKEEIEVELSSQDEIFAKYGFFIGLHTLEIDMMNASEKLEDKLVFSRIFNELTHGGLAQQSNFQKSLKESDYAACLKKVESNHSKIGKGRFAQSLSAECQIENIPNYIKDAIIAIYEKADNT